MTTSDPSRVESEKAVSPAWYEKYRVGNDHLSLPPTIEVYDFSNVKSFSPDELDAIDAAAKKELAARPAALDAAQRALYRHVDVPRIPLRDGTAIPAIGLGTWKAEKGQVKEAVRIALQAGYRFIDCASVYQNESEVGEALQHVLSRGFVDRKELYICSKLWNNDHAPDRVRAACLRTLKALRLDYLDLYLIHWPVTGSVGDEVRPPIRDTWMAMEQLVKDGLVRSIGTSNFSAKKMAEIMQYATVKPSVCQVEVHPYHRNDAFIQWCKSHDVHVTAFSPLGSPDSESIFPRKVPAVLLKDPVVQRIAAKTGRNVGQVLVRWALQHGTSVIPKSTNADRIRGNLDVLDWELSQEDYEALSSLRFQQRMVNGAMWLNPRGPYRTMEDLWNEPELIPSEEDWPKSEDEIRKEEAARAERALYHHVDVPRIPLRDGTAIPAIGLGTWKAEKGQVKEAVRIALQAGYRFIDCASVYQNESEVGEALQHVLSRGFVDRKELYICSKLWNNDHAPDRVRAACLRTLKALRLDYLDLYLIHWPVTGSVGDEVRPPIRDTWMAMEQLVKDGLVRSIGTSNFSAKKMAEIMQYATVKPSVCQVEVHPYHRNDAFIQWCKSHDVHVTAFSPLGSPDSESIFPRKVPAVLLKDPVVQRIAAKTGRNVGQVLVRWALQHGTSVIPKSTNADRIRGNLDVLDWELSQEDYEALSSLRFQQRMVNGAMWLNPRGPYRTMEDLWNEPELIPSEEDWPKSEDEIESRSERCDRLPEGNVKAVALHVHEENPPAEGAQQANVAPGETLGAARKNTLSHPISDIEPESPKKSPKKRGSMSRLLSPRKSNFGSGGESSSWGQKVANWFGNKGG